MLDESWTGPGYARDQGFRGRFYDGLGAEVCIAMGHIEGENSDRNIDRFCKL